MLKKKTRKQYLQRKQIVYKFLSMNDPHQLKKKSSAYIINEICRSFINMPTCTMYDHYMYGPNVFFSKEYY